jgi:hypothetical protein
MAEVNNGKKPKVEPPALTIGTARTSALSESGQDELTESPGLIDVWVARQDER